MDQKLIEIKCPIPDCSKEKKIEVPKYLFEKKKIGIIKIQIHKDVCCEHEFIAFIDPKGKVRAYEAIDMEIDLAEYADRLTGETFFLRDLLSLYGEYAVASMLHAMINENSILLLRKEEEKNHAPEINELFNSYLPKSYKAPLLVSSIEEKDYKKADIENTLVLSPRGLLANTPWQDIPLTYEMKLMRRAMDILDDESQSIIIEDQLQNLFMKSVFVKEVIAGRKEIYEDDLKDLLRKEFQNESEFSDYGIMLLKQIVNFRFKGDTSKIKIRSFSKLKEGLW